MSPSPGAWRDHHRGWVPTRRSRYGTSLSADGSRGSPSARSASTVSWISSVPPPHRAPGLARPNVCRPPPLGEASGRCEHARPRPTDEVGPGHALLADPGRSGALPGTRRHAGQAAAGRRDATHGPAVDHDLADVAGQFLAQRRVAGHAVFLREGGHRLRRDGTRPNGTAAGAGSAAGIVRLSPPPPRRRCRRPAPTGPGRGRARHRWRWSSAREQRGLGDAPARAGLAEHAPRPHAGPVRNTSDRMSCRRHLLERPGLDAGLVHVDEEVREPWCLGRPGSVLASSMPKSAVSAPEFQTFCPSITHSSPSGTARVPTLARSEPEPGSLNSWHQAASPSAIGRTNRATCSACRAQGSARRA